MPRLVQFTTCVAFLLGLGIFCYRRPVPEGFDRLIYEAILLSRSESPQVVYDTVKHENPRAEGSTVLSSPRDIEELKPLYAIRPLYLEIVALVGAFLPIRLALNFVSAASLVGLGLVVLIWTKKPLHTALLMAAFPILALGRTGRPDALSALLVVCALWLIEGCSRPVLGILLLLVSLGVRTDNILVLTAVLVWLAWERRVLPYVAVLAGLVGIATVFTINDWVGNYGWIVLFRYTFVGGRYPSQIPHTLTVGEYVHAFLAEIGVLFTQISLWLLIGLWAWMRRPNPLLFVVAGASAAHFVLLPSPESRYMIWAGIVGAILLIRSLGESVTNPPAAA